MSGNQPNPLSTMTPQHILSLLDKLHALSTEQELHLDITCFSPDDIHDPTRNAFIALDQDKCQFVYTLARAVNARNIVEAGTSFGVSTIYLGLAVSHNVEAAGDGKNGVVIATEHEHSKAEQARKHWTEAGEVVERHIDLREGDLRETLKTNIPPVDLLLIDSKSFSSSRKGFHSLISWIVSMGTDDPSCFESDTATATSWRRGNCR
jgi:predicted O-methyltransferase YrrM